MRLASFSGELAAPVTGRLRLGIALALVAGGAIAVAFSRGATVEERLLLAGIAVVVLGPTVVAVASRRFDLFSPQTIFAFAFGAMFLARPVAMLYNDDFLCCTVGAEANVRPGFSTMLLAVLLGAVAFQLGFFFYRRRSAASLEPSRKIDWDSRFVFRCSLGLGVLGTLLFGAFVLQGLRHHGLSSLNGRGTDQSALIKSSSAYLYDGMFLLAPATLLLAGSVAFGRERRRLATALAVLFGGLMVLSALPTGNRTVLLVLVGALFAFYFLRRRTRPKLVASLVVVLIAFFAISILRDTRYSGVRQQGVGRVILQAFEHPGGELGHMINGGEMSMAPAFSLETEIVPSQLGYRYGGATLGDIATRPIPHILWKGKPPAPEAALTGKVWPTEFASGLVHPVYSVMGTFYFDFGLFGVVAGMLLLGIGYRFVEARLLRSRDEGLLVISAALVPFLVIGLRDSFPDTVLHLVFAVAPLVLVVELARRRTPIRRMQWKRPALLVPVAVAVVLAVVFGGLESARSSTGAGPIEEGAIQPAMLVGASNPHGSAALPAVIASVRAARHGAPIPSPLVPSILGVQAYGAPLGCAGQGGVGVTRSEICYLAGPATTPSTTPTPGHKTLVVLGDERAAMWISPLLTMAGTDNWDIVPMWKAGCTAAVLYANSDAFHNRSDCHAWYAWALRTIARLHPNTVFTSFLGSYNGEIATKTENGIASLLATEKKDAKHVVLMVDPPYWRLSSFARPLDCLDKPDATLRTCTGSGGPSDSSRALEALAQWYHVGVIDPLGWFCYNGLCPLVIGHTIAFAYYGIVSTTYGNALGPPFRAAFRAALKGGSPEQGAVQPAMLVGASNPHGPAALPAVSASARAALRGVPIPSRLVPSSLSTLDAYGVPPGCNGANSGVTSSAICYVSAPSATPRSTPTPGHKTLVVLGDEHAEMWIGPLLAMAGRDNWDIVPMWKRGCTPPVLFANANSIGNRAECHAWYKWALRTIARLHPNTVFISFLNAYSGDIATKDARGIASLLASVKERARHAVLMLDIPFLSFLPQPRDCLHESGATLRTCTGRWGGTVFHSNHALRALARLHHVGVIDPLGWFCYERLCPLVLGHTIAFADYGLVSQAYATALSPPFRATFRAALHAR
jgi:SGNH domain-containing protein/O-antigen polysaccharide polymerase Wzy-like protein